MDRCGLLSLNPVSLVTSSEDGAGWLAFFRDLTARCLSGVKLITSDAHRGLTAAISATLPDASWQRHLDERLEEARADIPASTTSTEVDTQVPQLVVTRIRHSRG